MPVSDISVSLVIAIFLVDANNTLLNMRSILPHAMASLYSWLQKGGKKSTSKSSRSADNDNVQQVCKGKRRKRGRYYDAEVRAKIAKHAFQHGNKSAVQRFTQELGHCVCVRNMKRRTCVYWRVYQTQTRLLVCLTLASADCYYSGRS